MHIRGRCADGGVIVGALNVSEVVSEPGVFEIRDDGDSFTPLDIDLPATVIDFWAAPIGGNLGGDLGGTNE
jgi:hypothetical protein